MHTQALVHDRIPVVTHSRCANRMENCCCYVSSGKREFLVGIEMRAWQNLLRSVRLKGIRRHDPPSKSDGVHGDLAVARMVEVVWPNRRMISEVW